MRVPVRLQARKTFIESTRKQITTLRDEVQAHAQQSTTGFSTKAATKSGLPSIGKSKGYGKLGVQEEPIPPADDDIIDVENGAAPAANSGGTGTADEILGAELDAELLAPPPGRHRKKKACLALIILLLLVGAASASLLASGSPPRPHPQLLLPPTTGLDLGGSPCLLPPPPPPLPTLPPCRRRCISNPAAHCAQRLPSGRTVLCDES